MTAEPITIGEDTPLDEVVALMERRRIKRVPVVRDGKLVGIVSRANLVQALASYAHMAQAASVNDATIRDTILREIEQQPWAPKGLINVIVKDGIVSLWGAITDEREREALHVLAENTSGVKEVVDQLAWVEPMSGMLVQPVEDAGKRAKAS